MSNEKITASEAEQFVRAYWKDAIIDTWYRISVGLGDSYLKLSDGGTRSDAWLAAYQFTLIHKQKIADVEAETRYVNSMPRRFQTPAPEVQERLLARLESIRDELRRGVRDEEGK